MTIMEPIAEATEERWKRATTQFNALRGQAINHFARAEAAVSETLIALRTAGEAVKLQRLVGQRFDALRKTLDGCDTYGNIGAHARERIAAFESCPSTGRSSATPRCEC